MEHDSRLPIDIEIVHLSGQEMLKIHIYRDALRDWCLGLCLLREGLVETFTVIEQGESGRTIRFHNDSRPGTRARATLSVKASEVFMTRKNLGHVYYFFLKYYRDGLAEVDHLDLEAIDAETGSNEIYVTFNVSESKAPMTPEEAQRRLDDWS